VQTQTQTKTSPRKGQSTMTRRIAGLAAAALVSSGMSLAAFGLGTGIAQAQPYDGGNLEGTWCPGQPVPGGFTEVNWDWNVCNDYRLQITGKPAEIVGLKLRTAPGQCWPTVAGVSTNRTGDIFSGCW
jgi:hypothetical protein